jgi:hypothetical protein
MSNTYLPGSALMDFPALLRWLPDVDIQRPLWEFTPAERPAVIHERRRRFGVDDEAGFEVG